FKQKTAYEIFHVTGVQTCALPILSVRRAALPCRRAAAARTRTRSLRCLPLSAPMNTSDEPVAELRAVVNPNAAAPNEAYGARRRSEERRVGKECRSRW